ncbi:AT hook motif protein [Streptomyces sp. NPDC088762]|uniref:AT hook motif protein n=1 Tax=Streptomyces sp. NPDC088762 TaxID=3365891 RepID=UPI003814E3F4
MTPGGNTRPDPAEPTPPGASGGEPGPERSAPAAASGQEPRPERPAAKAGAQGRKQVLLRLDPQVYDALARWAGEELRSANAQIEFLLRRALSEAGRLPSAPSPIPRRGRPPKATD